MTAAEANVRILLATAVVVVAAQAAGWAISRIGQPRVHGEILAGVLLGPSLLGVVCPGALGFLFPVEVVGGLRVIAQLGLVLFMFLVGVGLDADHLRGHGHRAVVISNASIVVPTLLGVVLGWWLHPRLGHGVDRAGFVLFIGAAMAVTAFPVLARVLQETGLAHTRLGVLTITCAAVDDVTAWCLLATVVAVVTSSGPADAALTIALSVGYLVVMLAAVRPALARLRHVPLWAAVAGALASAWITEEIGVHAIFGAFIAGAVMPKDGRPDGGVAAALTAPTVTILLPVFFVVVGLSTRIDLLDSWYLWGVTALVTATAVAGKWGGPMLAARAVGETWRDAATIGILMNTRGLTELVILSVGLESGVLGPELFAALVVMALVTTLMTAPMLAIVSPDVRRAAAARPYVGTP